MTQKTAMQELREKLLTTTFLSGKQIIGIQPILDKLIEKEKQQIIDAINYCLDWRKEWLNKELCKADR
jgi:hypothetical protein